MALIECPECKHSISDTCDSCPHCGYKLKMISKNENYEDEIAKAEVLWTKDMNTIFQRIHWTVSGEKKKYIIFQIVFTLLGVLPGIYFALNFWIIRPLTVKKIYKNDLKNNGGVPKTMSYVFYDDYFHFSDTRASSDEKYVNFGAIALKDSCITFMRAAMNSGFCIPLANISDSKRVLDIVTKLPNFKQF